MTVSKEADWHSSSLQVLCFLEGYHSDAHGWSHWQCAAKHDAARLSLTRLCLMQNVQRDFVLGVLSEEELGQQIHIHELHREYATCVQTLRMYDAVSRDILQVCRPR